MKKLLIVKTGTTFASIHKIHGDFEDFIINQLDIPASDVLVSPVYRQAPLPELNDVSAVIITGSHAMVTDGDDWSVRLSEWLKNIAGKAILTLGLCYGHQLIAQAFGGIVKNHPLGIEIGTTEIELTPQGKKDPLLSVLPDTFLGHVTHYQTVTTLPSSAQLLAKNDYVQNHAFVLHDTIWGVQFHPEFNADILHAYIDVQKESLVKEGYDTGLIHASVKENPYGKQLLKRFISLA